MTCIRSRLPALLLMLAIGVGACRPKTSGEDLQLDSAAAQCRFEVVPGPVPEVTQSALHVAGQTLGTTRALAPALHYTERLTRDGYLVRGWAARLVMTLAGAGIGALLAALLLALWTRRPTPRWAERLGHSITREIEQLRALGEAPAGATPDPLAKALLLRFDEPLTIASNKAQRLVERAIPLAKRVESATAVAHLESLEAQLEGLLGRIERIHLQLLVWNERQLEAEDESVKAQVAAAIAELNSALEEVS